MPQAYFSRVDGGQIRRCEKNACRYEGNIVCYNAYGMCLKGPYRGLKQFLQKYKEN